MANENQIPSFPPTVKAPLDYPNTPQPGKIQILFDANKRDIYHRFSPYTDRGSLIGTGQKQPYVWRYPDEKNKGFGRKLPKFLRVLEDVGVSPTVSGADDVERIGEWLTSGYGIQYTIKQGILQAYNPFNETGLYNPISPLLATIQPVSLGLIDRPTRFIDQGSVLGAVLSALGLKGSFGGILDGLAGKIMGRSPYTTIPPGSVGYQGFLAPITGIAKFLGKNVKSPTNPLPGIGQDGGKGLLRGRTSIRAKSTFKSKWGAVGIGESFGDFIKDAIDPIIPNVIPRASGATYRNDEDAYFYMISDPTGRLRSYNRGVEIPLSQMWFADTKSLQVSARFIPIRSGGFVRDWDSHFVIGPSIDGKSTGYSLTGAGGGLLDDLLSGKGIGSLVLKGLGQVAKAAVMPYAQGIASTLGISLTGELKIKSRRYSDSVGISQDAESYENSDVLINYGNYINSSNGRFETKQDQIEAGNPLSITNVISSFKKVLQSINKKNEPVVYKTNIPKDSRILSSGNPTVRGYNRILDIDKSKTVKGSAADYEGVLVPPLEDGSTNVKKTLRMATTGKADGINQLGIIGKDRQIIDPTTYKAEWTEYRPYHDDLVAFFFYDVVNQKYIPFRATVQGINETGTAMWEEMKFIGRADMVYSYSGFSRNLAFQFKVVISSLSELLPTWKRINYIASSIKPSNYTKIDRLVYNKFMVPPMFMINIGDMYKFQPCIITSVSVTIPDDASWETLNQENAEAGWAYLDGLIKSSPAYRGKYAQFPREAEISITCNLLEKERAIVGGAHYGHAPHTQDYLKDGYIESDPNKPFLPSPTKFDEGLVEYQQVAASSGDPARDLTNKNNPATTFPVPPGPTDAGKIASVGQIRSMADIREENALLKLTKTPSTAQIIAPGNTSPDQRTY